MILLLPPSETKRDGGDATGCLDVAGLAFGELTDSRLQAIAALGALSLDVTASMEALSLGPSQRAEVERNRTLATSAVMPALARYTGVLFDALDASTLDAAQLAFAQRTVVIHSALFGLLRAGDLIPAYRLSHNSRLPGLSLRAHWRGPVAGALSNQQAFVLDLRSEAYAALGPAPEGSRYVRVVSEDARGRRLALSHFNKKGKGRFARALIAAGIDHDSEHSLLQWASASGIRLQPGAPGQLDLVV